MWKVECSWRQLLASAVAATGNLSEGPAAEVTLVIGKWSYLHLCACVSNSAESVLPLVPTPALDTHIKAGNAVLAPQALVTSWVPTGVAGGLAGHHSAPGPPRHADMDTGVPSSESTVPQAECASGVMIQVISLSEIRAKWWRAPRGTFDETLIGEAPLRSGGSGQERIWNSAEKVLKRKRRKEDKCLWGGFCCIADFIFHKKTISVMLKQRSISVHVLTAAEMPSSKPLLSPSGFIDSMSGTVLNAQDTYQLSTFTSACFYFSYLARFQFTRSQSSATANRGQAMVLQETSPGPQAGWGLAQGPALLLGLAARLRRSCGPPATAHTPGTGGTTARADPSQTCGWAPAGMHISFYTWPETRQSRWLSQWSSEHGLPCTQ